MRITVFILALIPVFLFGQTTPSNHGTIKIEKPQTETGCNDLSCIESKVKFMIGGRTINDNDTISASILLKEGKIEVSDNGEKDSVLCFTISIGVNGCFVEWKSDGDHFPEQAVRVFLTASKQGNFYIAIGKVCYESPNGNIYVIKNTLIKMIGDKQPPPPPPPPDTIKKWESKFDITIAGHDKGTISKKEILASEKIDITSPYDSTTISSFDINFEYLRANAFETTKLNSSDFAHCSNNKFSKEIVALIKKAPDNTAITISNISYTIGARKFVFKKTLNLLLK